MHQSCMRRVKHKSLTNTKSFLLKLYISIKIEKFAFRNEHHADLQIAVLTTEFSEPGEFFKSWEMIGSFMSQPLSSHKI